MNLILALVSAAAYGVSDFVGGIAARKHPALQVVLWSFPISATILFVMSWMIGGSWDTRALAYGAASGLTSALAGWWFFTALAEGSMSVVSPITSVLAAAIPVLFGVTTGEQLSIGVLAGIAFTVAAIVLISQESKDHPPHHTFENTQPPRLTRRVLLFTFGTGMAFALSFILVHQIGATPSGLWPMFASKMVASVITLLIALRFGHVHLSHDKSVLKYAMAVGVLDVLANIAMYYAFQGAFVSIISVLVSLYPLFTIALAIGLLKERTNALQKIGIALALCAIGLIAYAG
mgnify:CR=1 FL=1